MPNSVNTNGKVAIARLLELLSPNPLWNRSLWNIGLLLGMSELHEASTAISSGTLSEAAVRRLCNSVLRQCGKDPAVTKQEKSYLREKLKDVPRNDGAAHHALAGVMTLLNKDYLKRWATALGSPLDCSIERFGRSVASHLLDAGFSNTHLHNFIKSRFQSEPDITLIALCNELQQQMADHPWRDFKVLLAFAKPPKFINALPRDWLRAHDVSQWLQRNGFDTADVRASVGIELTVKARDSFGAATVARDQSDRFNARYAIATGESLQRLGFVWVQGAKEPVPLDSDSRGVRVRALHRENLVFAPSKAKNVDAAIELLAHLDSSSPTAAIAGGWGAIEGLLGDPGNRSSAAEHLAALVTCSLVRAELTPLSYIAEKQGGPIGDELRACRGNRARSALMAKLILENRLPPMESLSDMACVMRMSEILNDPKRKLLAVKEAVADAFHRLYRQRNLILHGGKLDSVGLSASLRTVAKLAGAGMDRIAHGQYVQSLRPLELVARADISISLIDKDSALSCVDLLEPG